MKGSSSCYAGGLLLAATLATAEKASVIAPTPTHTMRNLQDVPAVGVGFEAGDSSIVISGSRTSSTATAVTEELIDALEQDDQVTVVGEVQLGSLLCESLIGAEDASMLQFKISPDETIVAEKLSYTVYDGEAFTDNTARKVWTGDVVDVDTTEEDEGVPRTVSMTWGDVCDVETFLLKVTTRNQDGSTSMIKTVPCDAGSELDICLVEVHLEFDEAGDTLVPPDTTDLPSSTSDEAGRRNLGTTRITEAANAEPTNNARNLQSDTEIDVMVLYSDAGLELLNVSPAQMETTIIESLVWTNAALSNSLVAATFNLVHVGPLPYAESDSDGIATLTEFRLDETVGEMRDTYGADLVQLIGFFDDGFCGWGYTPVTPTNPAFAFSLVKSTCLDDFVHTHEFGHNMGCNHNRDSSNTQFEYSHGLRYCDGTDPYRTVMSYSCGSPRVNYFSNPDVSYLGKPTGTATEDNARVIDENKELVAAFRSRTATPAPTPAPSQPTTPEPSAAGGLVDAATRTTVTVSASAYDEEGCGSSGCSADLTRDSDSEEDDSRWSCHYDLEDSNCKLWYRFEDPQYLDSVELAFYKGDQRTRSFLVKTFNSDNTRMTVRFTSSGVTDGFESFEVGRDDVAKMYIQPIAPDRDEWISIKEARLMVE